MGASLPVTVMRNIVRTAAERCIPAAQWMRMLAPLLYSRVTL